MMPYAPKYDSDAIMAYAEKSTEPDLRDAFIIQGGLRAYLHTKCGCWFAETPRGSGKFALQSTREPDKGKTLAHGMDFLTMLEMALSRAESKVE